MRKIESKKIIGCLCVILFILTIVSVSFYQKTKQSKVISIGVFAGSPWGVPDAYTYEFIEDAIGKFEEEHPGVKVEYISGIMCDEYSEWLAGKVVGGNAPDVFMVLPEDFSTLQKTGSLLELDSLIKQDNLFDANAFYSGAYDFGSVGNSQYALPLECVPEMMFVNKTLLAKETILLPDTDWTWDEFYDICRKITKDTDGNGVIDQFGVYNYNWRQAFLTNSVKPFDEAGDSCYIQGENAIEAIEFLQKMYNLTEGTVVTANDFDRGKVAFMPFTLAEYRTYKPYPWSIKRFSSFDWECVTLPKGPHGDNVSRMNTLLMGINSRTKKKQLAWELMKTFCYDKEIQNEIYKYRAGGAALSSILKEQQALLIENQELPKNGSINVRIINSIMENAIEDYNFKDVSSVLNMLNQGITEIIQNDKNPEISLKQLQREINYSFNK